MIQFYKCLIIFFLFPAFQLQISAGSEDTQITFASFSADDNILTLGDGAYNPANRSHIINAGAATHSSKGTCGALLYGEKVRIQEVASGRVASFSTSFSFTFTTHGLPWDIRNNPRDGSGFAFVFVHSMMLATLRDVVSQIGQDGGCKSPRTENNLPRDPSFSILINTDYDPHHHQPSNNNIQISRSQDYELHLPAYTYNLCGYNDTHCSYFSNGRIFTAWIDYTSASKTLEVRLANGSIPTVKKPLQPLLLDRNYTMPTVIGDDVYLTFWGSSDVNHVEAHELLSWSFFSSWIISETESHHITPNSSQMLLYFSKASRIISIIILGTLATVVILWSIFSRFASWPLRNNRHRYTALGYFAAGPHIFSYTELRKATDNFDERNLLGSGASGSVYRGSLEGGPRGSRTLVAVKQITFSESKQAESVFHAEVSSLGQIRHRNVVQLLGWCQEKGRLLLVYDYMPNGGLNEWLHKCGTSHFQRQVLSLQMRHSILEGVGAALEYLHEDCMSCILHRDIKSSNVLLDAEFKAHLGDFGLARLMNHHKLDKTTMAAGTLGYMAPEMPYTGKATKESDVYSFGILVLEVVCARRPLDMQAVEPEDLVLLYSVWRAHEAESLSSMADPRLLQTLQPSRSVSLQNDRSISVTELPSLPSHNLIGNNIPISIVVDVDVEVQKTMVVNLLRLGLMCCLPNPKARPSMGQVNGMLQQIRDMQNVCAITSISMPSLPTTKPPGLYRSLEFSQTALSSTSSARFPVSSAQVQSLINDSILLEEGFERSLHKDD